MCIRDRSYKVSLRSFEGPFDLLVYLIENAQMSIYDIRISEITSQYLDYIDRMNAEDLNMTARNIRKKLGGLFGNPWNSLNE